MSKKTLKSIKIGKAQINLLALPNSQYFKFEIFNPWGAYVESALTQKTGKEFYGLSHLAEHMSFKSTRDYTSEKLLEILKSYGTYNAYTDHDGVGYWFESSMTHVDLVLNVVANIAMNDFALVTDAEYETEKNVVINEIKRYADNDQTMFTFNAYSEAVGKLIYDNVLGSVESVTNSTLEDLRYIKKIFLSNPALHFNVIYDPTMMNQTEMAEKILRLMSGFPIVSPDIFSADEYMIASSTKLIAPSNRVLNNSAEQNLTYIMLDIGTDINKMLFSMATEYLGYRANETSINDLIREKYGLTYGISFYNFTDTNKEVERLVFSCDVSKGTENLMMQLLLDAMIQTVDTLTEESFVKFKQTVLLNSTLNQLNLKRAFNFLFCYIRKNPSYFNVWREKLDNDVVSAIEEMYSGIDYNLFKQCLEFIRDKFIQKDFVKITNY